jgi:hypothetical protein
MPTARAALHPVLRRFEQDHLKKADLTCVNSGGGQGTSMEQREAIVRARAALAARGVHGTLAGPPIYLLLWRVGINVRPPAFQSFVALFLFLSSLSAALFALLLFAAGAIVPDGSPGWHTAAAATFSGLLFGVVMASYSRLSARRLRLPSWDEVMQADHHHPERRER